MNQHVFSITLTGGEVREPMIRLHCASTEEDDPKLKEDVFRALDHIGFVFIETKHVGPLAIPEMNDSDHYFESNLGKIKYIQDHWNGFDFIMAKNQPGVIEKIAAFLAADKKFHMLQSENLDASDKNSL